MRKFITFMAVALLTVTAISSCKKTDPYNEALNKEYAEFMAEHHNGVFYESHIILNKNLEDVKSYKDLSVVGCENVFQDSTFCYIVTHDFVEGTTNTEVVRDFWLGSEDINPNELKLTLTDALKTYWKSDFKKTTGNKVTLRSPVGPVRVNPLYIIGQHNSPLFVSVDAITGEVKQII